MTEEEIWEQQQMRKAEERRQEDAEMERLEQERLARAERSPTLTDAEREAIEGAMWDYGQYADEMGLSATEAMEKQAALRGLLERTNYPAKGDSSTGLR
jgi:hypothetical protein